MVPPLRRFATGAALLCVVVLFSSVLAGCSLLQGPEKEPIPAAEKVAHDVGKLPGVETARSEVSGGGYRGRTPVVTIRVRLRETADLTAGAAAAFTTFGVTPLPAEQKVALELTGAAGAGVVAADLATVAVTASRARPVGAWLRPALQGADAIRRISVVERVDASSPTLSVRLADPALTASGLLGVAAAGVRSVPGFGSGALSTVILERREQDASRSFSVEVAAGAPSAALLAALDDLAGRPDVSALVHTQQHGAKAPLVDVESADPESAARLLTAVAVADDLPGHPRTAFRTHTAEGQRLLTGFVGVPLAGPDASAPGADAAAVQESYEETLRAFLRASADTDTADCSIADDRSVRCAATLPLWHAPDTTEEDVEARMAAISAAWRRAGLVGEDRALGTEIWGRGPNYPGPAGVLVARLRGTTDGITLTVESPPVR